METSGKTKQKRLLTTRERHKDLQVRKNADVRLHAAAQRAQVVATLQATDNASFGEAAGIAGIQGQMSPQRVVEQVLAAERTLQAAIAVRDKLVGAYLEINRMQI